MLQRRLLKERRINNGQHWIPGKINDGASYKVVTLLTPTLNCHSANVDELHSHTHSQNALYKYLVLCSLPEATAEQTVKIFKPLSNS